MTEQEPITFDPRKPKLRSRVTNSDGTPVVGTAEGFTLLGNSSAFNRMLLLVEKLSKVNAPVLLEGETGTGKGDGRPRYTL